MQEKETITSTCNRYGWKFSVLGNSSIPRDRTIPDAPVTGEKILIIFHSRSLHLNKIVPTVTAK